MRIKRGENRRKYKLAIRTSLPIILGFLFMEAFSQCDAVIGSNIGSLNGCEVFTIQFSDLSSNVITRTWDFGDGTPTSAAQNPLHSFIAGEEDTTYIVRLTITCASGTNTAEKTVNVYAKPDVDFTSDKSSVCAITDSVCFTNSSDYHVSNSYSWNFGDGTVSNQFEPCKVYSTPGTYPVTLTVSNEHGCLDTYIKNDFVKVEPVPSTAFSVSNYSGCAPFTVVFENITDTIGDVYSNWSWDFGDGSPNSFEFEASPHTFNTPGEYTVRLGATNSLGCYNYSTQIITVKPSPVAKFITSSPECQNEFTSIEFTGSYNSSPSFYWSFDSASIINGAGQGPFDIKWNDPGNKKITLTVTEGGCSSSFAEKVQVTPISNIFIHISASHDTICSNQSVSFTASPFNYSNYSFYLNSTIVQNSSNNVYEDSNFQDGDKIYVKITDINGCKEIISDTVTVNVKESPEINLTSNAINDTACINDPVIFTATPDFYDNYTFFVNNIETQTGQGNILTTSSLSNKDRVSAIAINNECISKKSNEKITIIKDALPPPQVYCGTSTPNSIEFSWDEVPNAIAYEISIDNGPFQTASSGVLGLSHELTGLSENDEHTIKVQSIDNITCGVSLISDEVRCKATSCTAITYEQSAPEVSVCEGETVNLFIKNINIPNYSIEWDDGSSTIETEYSLTAVSNDQIPIVVSNTDEPLCPSVKKTYNLSVTPLSDLIISSSAPSNAICKNNPIELSVTPVNLENYEFFDNDKLIESGVENTFSFSEITPGHFYFAKAINGACIFYSDTIQINVVEPLKIPVVNFKSSTDNHIVFSWNAIPEATGYLVSIDNEVFTYPSSGSTGLEHTVSPLNPGDAASITVIALGDGLCGNSEISLPAIGYAEICDTINFNIIDEYNICKGDSIKLEITDLNIPNYSITWGLSSPSELKSIWIQPKNDTTIFVTVRNTDQPFCSGITRLVTISVNERPEPISLSSSDADNEICMGQSIRYKAEPGGFDSYQFYDNGQLINESSFSTLQITGEKAEYNIKVRADNNGCIGNFSNLVNTKVISGLKTPQVNCGITSENTISFVWDPIPDVVSFEVSVNNQAYSLPSTGSTGLKHDLSGLTPGDSATIKVIALGKTSCENSVPSLEITCYAKDCEAINFKIDPYHNICEKEIINLEVTDITTTNYSLSWNDQAFGSIVSNVLEGLKDTLVSVKLRDNNQPLCPTVSKIFDINVRNTVPVSLISNAINDSICKGDLLKFTVLPELFERYVFYQNGIVIQDSSLNTFESSVIPNNSIVYSEVFQKGCMVTSDSKTTEIITPQDVFLSAPITGSVCQNELVEFTASSGFKKYIFSSETGILKETTDNILSISMKDSLITVSAGDMNNCKSISKDTLHFNILPLPKVSLSCSNDTICFGEYVTYYVNPEGLKNYTFYKNSIPLQSSNGNYYATDSLKTGELISATGTDANECTSKKTSISLPYIIPYPDYSIFAEDEGLCLNDTLTMYLQTSLSKHDNFYWNTGETSDTISISPQTTTIYKLFYSDDQCNNINIDSKTIYVDTETPPVAYAGEDVTICIYDSIQLNAQGGLNYRWSPAFSLDNPDIFNPFANPEESTVYLVTVSNAYCKDVDSILVTVDLCLEGLTDPIPQIITPNGDDINDYWEIINIDYFENNSVEIFNRWGNKVYSARPYNNEWNGKSDKNIDLPDGTYFYILNLGNGSPETTGYIIIHR